MPGVSLRLAFQEMDQQQSFFLFNKKHSDLVELFLNNNVGGPAIIFDRWQEVGECLNYKFRVIIADTITRRIGFTLTIKL